MSYSCVDFTDSILVALAVKVPQEHWDSPAGQADVAIAEIERLQRFEHGVRYALHVLADTDDRERFVARIRNLAEGA